MTESLPCYTCKKVVQFSEGTKRVDFMNSVAQHVTYFFCSKECEPPINEQHYCFMCGNKCTSRTHYIFGHITDGGDCEASYCSHWCNTRAKNIVKALHNN